ncbi:MAG TPA: alpha-hydroxy acid oxidase [Pseudolabrys sp.]|nr:alpha-hydroxy acid oxidase [Pseudolabrys sp.]
MMTPLTQIPAEIASVSDYEALAQPRMTSQAWAYLAGGDADERTLAENAAAFARLLLRTRVLRNLDGGTTQLDLFGHRLTSPLILAPIAFQKLAHPDGELATVLGAGAAQTAMTVSTQASVSLEAIAQAAAAPLWFQLYIQPDRAFTETLVRRAEAAGYRALVVTVDAPVSGIRNREQRAGFALPPGIEAVNLRGMAPPPPSALPAMPGGQILLGGPLLAAAPTWRDLAWLRGITRLPILLKGVMCADDAATAVAEGVDGIVVSNHGGRTLDTQPATVTVLPEIVHAAGGRVPVLLDGGIRRGTDILKALALGARAVLIGRPYMHGLAAAGAPGVCHVLRLLRAEFEVAMALTGCRALADIDAALLRT